MVALLLAQAAPIDVPTPLPFCLITSLGVTAFVFLAIGIVIGYAIGVGAAANAIDQGLLARKD